MPPNRRAAVGRLHNPRPAAGRNHVVAKRLVLPGCRDQPGELAGGVVEAAPLAQPAGPIDRPPADRIVRPSGRLLPRLVESPLGGRRLGDLRAAEDYDRRADPALAKIKFRFQQLQFDAGCGISGRARKSTSL